MKSVFFGSLATKFPRIVRAPGLVECVEIQGLVHTMGGARANSPGISLQKINPSKCQAGISWKLLQLPVSSFLS